MRALYFLLAIFALGSCSAPGTITLTPAQLEEPGGIQQPLDTLAAYRKMPGQPKTVHVQGYTRQDGTEVPPYNRTPPQ